MRWRGLELSGTLAFENQDNADRDVYIRNTNKHKLTEQNAMLIQIKLKGFLGRLTSLSRPP